MKPILSFDLIAAKQASQENNKKRRNQRGRTWTLKQIQLIAFLVALIVFDVPCVKAQGLLVEIGQQHISSCPTYGQVMEMQRGLFSNTWSPNFIVGGSTSALNKLYQNPSQTGCSSKQIAFFQRYSLDTATITPVLTLSRYFGETAIYNGDQLYFNNIAAIKFEYSQKTQNGQFYAVAVKSKRVVDDSFGGTLILFHDEASNQQLKTTFLTQTTAPPEQNTAYLFNEHPIVGNNQVKFEFGVNDQNQVAPMFPRINTLTYDHFSAMPKISLDSKYIAQNTLLGVSAFYREVDIELRAAVLHYNGDVTKDMTPAIYYSIRGIATEQSMTEHICCSANTPGYSIDSFVVDKNEVNSINKMAYAASLPLNFPSLTRQRVGAGGKAHMIIYTIQFSAAQNVGCQSISKFAQDIFAQHQTGGFFAKLQSLTISDSNFLRAIITVAQTEDKVGFIGTDGHHIQDILIRKMSCFDITNGVMKQNSDGTGLDVFMAGKSAYSSFILSDDKTAETTYPLFTYFSGAVCKSGSPPTNPCYVQQATRTDYLGAWPGLFYMVNTVSKFTYSPSSFDDGFGDVPLDSSGSVTLTNGGSNSIIVATSKLGQYTALAFKHAGITMSLTYQLFYIDRQINAAVSGSTSISLALSSWVTDSTTDNIQCLDFANQTGVTAMSASKVFQFDPANYNQNHLLQQTAVDFDPSTWYEATKVTCGVGKFMALVQFGVVEAGTTTLYKGLFDLQASAIKFSFVPNAAVLMANSVTKYEITYSVNGMTPLVFNQICINNGIAWNQPSLSACTGESQPLLESAQNRLFKDEATGINFWSFNTTKILLQPVDTPSQVCSLSDTFSLVQSETLYLDYDVSHLPYSRLQSEIVSNPTWVDSIQSINMVVLNSDFMVNHTMPFGSNKFTPYMPTSEAEQNINITFYWLAMHRRCSSIISDAMPLSQFKAGTSLAQNPLSPYFMKVNIRYTRCNEVFQPKPGLNFFIRRTNSSQIQLLEDSIINLFESPTNSLCAIKEWYVSDLSTNTKLSDTDPLAIRLQQPLRQDKMEPLRVDSIHNGGIEDITLQFRIQVLLRGDSSQPLLSVLHSLPAAVSVVIGCYHLKTLTVEARPSFSHPNFKQFNSSTSQLILVVNKPSGPVSGVFNLSQMLNFSTDHPDCSPHRIQSFADTFLANVTSEQDPLRLATNPTVESADGGFNPLMAYDFNLFTQFPQSIYLRIQTKGPSIVQKDLKATVVVCDDQPSAVDDKPLFASLMEHLDGSRLFNIASAQPGCSDFVFKLSTTAEANSEQIDSLAIQNNMVVIGARFSLKGFYIIVVNKSSGKSASKQVVINQQPRFETEVQVMHLVNVTIIESKKLIEQQKYSYVSPRLVDPDNHPLTMKIVGTFSQYDFLRTQISSLKDIFTIEVDRQRVRESGVYNATLQYGDQYSPNSGFITISIQINFSNRSSVQLGKEDEQIYLGGSVEQQWAQIIDATEDGVDFPELGLIGVGNNNLTNFTGIESTLHMLKHKNEMEDALEVFQHLISLGFKFMKDVGMVFPSLPLDYLVDIIKKAQLARSQQIFFPETELTVSPISTSGKFSFRFNQEMLLPPQIDHEMYAKIVRLSVRPAVFTSEPDIAGKYVWNNTFFNQTRRLMQAGGSYSTSIEGLNFNYSVVAQSSSQIDFQLSFQDNRDVSSYLIKDHLQIDLIRPQVFRSAQSLKPLDFGTKTSDQVRIIRQIPPQLSDQLGEAIQEATDSFQLIFQILLSQSGFFALLMQASLSSLWGLIRAIQLILFSTLVQIPLPAHAFSFLAQMVFLAQVDPFDGAVLYQQIFNFFPTEPVNPNFEFYMITDSNFILNTGSYFILQVYVLASLLLCWMLNKVAVSCARNRCFRSLGTRVYYQSYLLQVYNACVKLYIESYFDLSCCVMMSFHAMVRYGIFNFWQERDDIICSLVTFVFAMFAIIFPLQAKKAISRHFKSKAKPNKYLEVFQTNCHQQTLLSSLYEVVFVARRFWTMLILILMQSLPQFQIQLLLVFSFINLLYLVSVKPLRSKRQNKMEIFNECCINLCAYIMVITCDPAAMSPSTKDILGWVLIGIVCLSIIVNMFVNVMSSILEIFGQFKAWYNKRAERQLLKKKYSLRDSTYKHFFPKEFAHFETEHEMEKALEFIKNWQKQREWLINNKIEPSTFEEESQFQQHMHKLNLYRGARVIRKLMRLNRWVQENKEANMAAKQRNSLATSRKSIKIEINDLPEQPTEGKKEQVTKIEVPDMRRISIVSLQKGDNQSCYLELIHERSIEDDEQQQVDLLKPLSHSQFLPSPPGKQRSRSNSVVSPNTKNGGPIKKSRSNKVNCSEFKTPEPALSEQNDQENSQQNLLSLRSMFNQDNAAVSDISSVNSARSRSKGKKNLLFSVVKPLLTLDFLDHALKQMQLNHNQPYLRLLQSMANRNNGEQLDLKTLKQMLKDDMPSNILMKNKARKVMGLLIDRIGAELKTVKDTDLAREVEQGFLTTADFLLQCDKCGKEDQIAVEMSIIRADMIDNPSLAMEGPRYCSKCGWRVSPRFFGFTSLPTLIQVDVAEVKNSNQTESKLQLHLTKPGQHQVLMQEYHLFAVIFDAKQFYELAILQHSQWILHTLNGLSRLKQSAVVKYERPQLVMYLRSEQLSGQVQLVNRLFTSK